MRALAAAAVHRFAGLLTTIVLVLNTITLTLFLTLADSTPLRGGLLELLWVYDRQVLGFALAGSAFIALPLSVAAWVTSRRTRLTLLVIWIAFAAVLLTHRREAVEIVSRIVWKHRVAPALEQ
ncbi:MAG: hypothetical protein KJZ69_14540 [Phycisphaerales bacterium]|nr:hypothetical protein [Phycisphaerales bacterium]